MNEWKWDENKAIKLPVNVHCLHDAMHSGSLEKDIQWCALENQQSKR